MSIDSNFALAHAELGAAYYWANDRPTGDRHFDRALALLDRLTAREQLGIRATIESYRGSRERAIELRRAILAEYPNDPVTWGAIGYDYLQLDRPREALDAYRRQLARDSGEASYYVNLALVHKQLGDHDAARRSYERAFALQPALLRVNNLNHEYGILLVITGQAAEARAVYDSIRHGGALQRAHAERSLGLLAMYEGRHEAAITHFREAVLLSEAPNARLTFARNLLFLSAAQREKGGVRGDSADAALVAAHALFQSNWFEPVFLAFLGKALVRGGRTGQAVEVLDTLRRRARADNPGDRSHLLVLEGEVALALGHADSASRLLRMAYAIDSSMLVTESLARALAVVGDLDAATTLYEKVVVDPAKWYGWEAQPYAMQAPLELGRLYLRMGDTSRAAAAYRRLLERWGGGDPDLAAAREARTRLAELRSDPEERR